MHFGSCVSRRELGLVRGGPRNRYPDPRNEYQVWMTYTILLPRAFLPVCFLLLAVCFWRPELMIIIYSPDMIFFLSWRIDVSYFLKEMLFSWIPNRGDLNEQMEITQEFYGFGKDHKILAGVQQKINNPI